MRWTTGWLCVACLAGCGADLTVRLQLGQPIELDMGETAQLDNEGLTIQFLRLENDSRCPSDVNCVTAGEATVTVQVRKAPEPATQLSLTLPGAETASYLDYQLRLVELDPYPVSTVSSDPNDYRATVVATRP